MGHQNKYDDPDIENYEKAKYLQNQSGFKNHNFGNNSYNFVHVGWIYARGG